MPRDDTPNTISRMQCITILKAYSITILNPEMEENLISALRVAYSYGLHKDIMKVSYKEKEVKV